MKRICTICARGGSKGVKGKNLKEILGKPLLSYSIEQAQQTGLFDYIVVSSDSEDILEVAAKFRAHYCVKRPAELATDTAPKIPVIKHCVAEAEKFFHTQFDTFVDLDCTSPLRSLEDIRNVVQMVEEKNCSNVITGMPSRRSPYFNLVEETSDGFVKLSKTLEKGIFRRQDAPKSYDMNASIYAWPRESFFEMQHVFSDKTKIYVMPEERSIDIDSDLDFKIVKLLMEMRNEAKG